MPSVHPIDAPVQPDPAAPIPPELVEILDPFGAEFAGFPDEAPELPYGCEFDPFDEFEGDGPAPIGA